jgi:phosphatidate cytidylyltransferase
MLKQRVVTALVLVVSLTLILFWLPAVYAVAAFTAIAVLAAWEWSRMLPKASASSRVLFPAWILGCCTLGLIDTQVQLPFCLVATLFWLLVPLWLAKRWPLAHRGIGFVVGTIVIVPAWVGMIRLQAMGPWTLIAAMALVWVADISAYFVGRAIGRHKLAPAVSPGKTWEGAGGAVVGALLYVILLQRYAPIALPASAVQTLAATVFLVAVSIVGDLFESMIKRQAGVKDSSQLLPGHGGVLDRIDSLTSTLPVIVVAVALA